MSLRRAVAKVSDVLVSVAVAVTVTVIAVTFGFGAPAANTGVAMAGEGSPGVGETLSQTRSDDILKRRWRVVQFAGETVGMAGDVTFDGGRLTGASACNFVGGRFELFGVDGLRIDVDRMTRRGCAGTALDLERRYLEALNAVRRYRVDGQPEARRLTFMDADGSDIATLVGEPELTLEGTALLVVSYLQDGGLHSVNPGEKPKLRFADGVVSGRTVCGAIAGRYTIEARRLTVRLDALDAVEGPDTEGGEGAGASCTNDDKKQDAAIRKALQESARFDVARNVIRLLLADRDWATVWLARDKRP